MKSFSELPLESLSWEIELTTRCNSRCVGCSRQIDYYYPNPFFEPRIDLGIEILKKALKSSPKIDFILFCGVYGDPLLHPNIFEIFSFIRENWPDVKISVHTNGAFGSENFWQRLAEYFKAPGSHIKFSIDGLKGSHEQFRRGTQWETVIANAEQFIQAGGRAVWKMIEFDHNRNDIAEAQNLSTQKGFRKFELRRNNFPGLDTYISHFSTREEESSTKESHHDIPVKQLADWNEKQIQAHPITGINCSSLDRKNLYLDAHGKVWPCCWLGGLPYRPEHSLRQWSEKLILNQYENDFNSLRLFSLDEILNKNWFSKDLPESWNNTKTLSATCLKTCGVRTI